MGSQRMSPLAWWRMKGLHLVCLCASLALAPPALALRILENLGPQPTLAGVSLSCGGIKTYVADIGDVAMAERGRLLLSQAFFELPAPVQWFVYSHECAHQRVGGNEGAADCLAVQRGREQGFLDVQALEAICAYVSPLPEDRTHLGGPQRCERIRSCFARP